MKGQSKEILKNYSLKNSKENKVSNIYANLFEQQVYTPLPSFKKAIQTQIKIPNFLNTSPSTTEINPFKLPKCEKLAHVLKQQSIKREKTLTKIKVQLNDNNINNKLFYIFFTNY